MQENKEQLRQIFETVRQHLMEQKKRAAIDDNCQYRTVDGLKCAVGCLIKDEHYNPDIESTTITRLRVSDGKWEGTALAESLNNSGVPATEQVRA